MAAMQLCIATLIDFSACGKNKAEAEKLTLGEWLAQLR